MMRGLSLLVLLCGFATTVHAATKSIDKPNIIFILADDYGIGEVGAYGGDAYKTPHIDALAKSGIRFSHAYTVPLCGPSRAQILSGRYPFRTGATNQDATGVIPTPDREIFMPRILKSAGYVSTMIGKWGQLPLRASDYGFDDSLQFKGSGIYWNTQAKGRTYEVNDKTVALRDKEYMPDVMHNHLINFLEQNRNKPFYAYYSLSAVHNEILPTPDSVPGSKTLYADNVHYMDKLVGKLMQELERLHLRENTLIVFFGDNGTAAAQARMATIGGRQIHGSKGTMLEGGSRVPLIVNWKGVTPVGVVADNPIDSSDFLPTFAEITGTALPANTIIDGRSFAPQLRGQPGQKRDWIFTQLARKWQVQEAGFKLNQSGELFSMADEPFGEILVDKDSKEPAVVAARARLQRALESLNPAGGFLDQGDGTGRHAVKDKDKKLANKEKED